MRTVRVYSKQPLHAGSSVNLATETARHVAKVLRMRAGDTLVLFDGSGTDFEAVITIVERSKVAVDIQGERASVSESPLRITLWHGICRGSRMDFVVQKATELGVAAIQPVLVERSIVKLDEERALKKSEHWRSIAISAAEQSGRSIIPEVHAPASLGACLQKLSSGFTGFLLHPGAHPGLTTLTKEHKELILLTGPEGGFTSAECEHAVKAGFQLATMGPRILRSETAPAAAIAIVQSLAGDLA